MEQYLPRCIDSILAQTFTDFELLLIDDGSPDNSGKICDEYAKKDERIRVFHKANEGVSVARNIGIGHSSGTYLMFLDSDDWLESNCLDYCFKSMIDDNLDFFQFGYARVTEEGNVLYDASTIKPCFEPSGPNCFNQLWFFIEIITSSDVIFTGIACCFKIAREGKLEIFSSNFAHKPFKKSENADFDRRACAHEHE